MRKSVLLPVVGLVLLVVGAAIPLSRRVAFGWTAYTPLVSEPATPRIIALDLLNVLALLIAAAGIALLAGVVGFRIARREQDGDDPPPR